MKKGFDAGRYVEAQTAEIRALRGFRLQAIGYRLGICALSSRSREDFYEKGF